jgi:predicted DsbA family dithiol-disulfide isomerase
MVRLDIFSDPICPWCYIGKKNLDDALVNAPSDIFDIRWHPFQLNPDMPVDGMDRRAYLEGKFGGKEGAVKAYTPVVEHAKRSELNINLEAITRTPNTLNAHRLIHWAEAEGIQTTLVQSLFIAYFEQGRDLGDTDVLVDIAHRASMDREAIAQNLDTDNDLEYIKDRDASGRKMGLNGVPAFVVAGQQVVQGAQGPDLWTRVISDISKQMAQTDVS